jgi:hypothetical protein
MKSVMTYSRESYTNLYSRVLMMFRLIRSGEFNPDLSALERVVLLSDSVCEANMGTPCNLQLNRLTFQIQSLVLLQKQGRLARNALRREQLQARSSLPCSLIFQGRQSHR